MFTNKHNKGYIRGLVWLSSWLTTQLLSHIIFKYYINIHNVSITYVIIILNCKQKNIHF